MDNFVQEWLPLIVSIFSTACIVATSYIRDVKKILVLLATANLAIAMSYFLQGPESYNGAISCTIGSGTAIISGIYDIKGKDIPLWVSILYGAVFTIANLLGWTAWYSSIVIVASLMFAISTVQKTGPMYRVWTWSNIFLWIVYDIVSGSDASLVSHLCTFAFMTSGMLIDMKKEGKLHFNPAKIRSFFNKYFFHLFAVAALLLPDIQLRFLVWPKVYGSNGDIALFAAVIPTLFNLAWIGLFLYFSLVVLPKRWGRILYIILGSIFIFFSFAEYIYFQIFGQFFRLNSIGLAGEGSDYLSYALSHLNGWVLGFTLTSIALLVFAAILWHRPKHTGKIAKVCTLIPVLVMVGLHLFMQPTLFDESEHAWDAWSKPRIIYSQFTDPNKSMDVAGLYQFAARDIYKIYLEGSDYEEEDYKKAEAYFEAKAKADNKNQYSGILEGKNVIAVMLEGIDDWQISEKYTPTMKYMMDNGINFANHHAPTFGTGYTLASEFCFNVGYYIPTMSSTIINYVENPYPHSMPQLFRDKGYSVHSFHYNNPEFYNRRVLHHSLGYEAYHSFQDYGIDLYDAQTDSIAISNNELYESIVKDEPFFSFIVTYSGHLPYTDENDGKLKKAKRNHPELIDPQMDRETNNCLILARDTDDFFRILLENLNRDGKLEDTVFVVYTDHYTYSFSDQEKLLEYNKSVGDDVMFRVPAFIYTPGLEPTKITKPSGTADLLPTIINLFNLCDNHTYIGSDILDPDNQGFVYFHNGSWMEGSKDSDDVYYFDPNEKNIPENRLEQVKNGNNRIREMKEINDIVIDGNYFKRIKKD